MSFSATFSDDRVYRYTLHRGPLGLGGVGTALWCMLNPSTADETNDDPTVRRVLGFSAAWGYRFVTVVNIFAFRATDPKVMMAAADPVGPENDEQIGIAARDASEVICAWGAHGIFLQRGARVLNVLRDAGANPACLGWTANGQPRHPLYLPADERRRPMGDRPDA